MSGSRGPRRGPAACCPWTAGSVPPPPPRRPLLLRRGEEQALPVATCQQVPREHEAGEEPARAAGQVQQPAQAPSPALPTCHIQRPTPSHHVDGGPLRPQQIQRKRAQAHPQRALRHATAVRLSPEACQQGPPATAGAPGEEGGRWASRGSRPPGHQCSQAAHRQTDHRLQQKRNGNDPQRGPSRHAYQAGDATPTSCSGAKASSSEGSRAERGGWAQRSSEAVKNNTQGSAGLLRHCYPIQSNGSASPTCGYPPSSRPIIDGAANYEPRYSKSGKLCPRVQEPRPMPPPVVMLRTGPLGTYPDAETLKRSEMAASYTRHQDRNGSTSSSDYDRQYRKSPSQGDISQQIFVETNSYSNGQSTIADHLAIPYRIPQVSPKNPRAIYDANSASNGMRKNHCRFPVPVPNHRRLPIITKTHLHRMVSRAGLYQLVQDLLETHPWITETEGRNRPRRITTNEVSCTSLEMPHVLAPPEMVYPLTRESSLPALKTMSFTPISSCRTIPPIS
ncbi:uncharacterized protein CEXT_531581 [Caerostris extrusa]|uniref:Uncharacterized protein n=1 Tax=Caerostris extrusa TaxID=172846 RepID=A0AAV4WFJ3_CAEEX|nr:uncharacterized protein CEXT_531581 [Caerostris extrusa]